MANYPVTAQDMYFLCLELLRKQKTSSLTTAEFHTRINSVQLGYLKTLGSLVDQSQIISDKLSNVIVRNFIIANTGNNIAGQEKFLFPINYYRLLNISFKLNYVKSGVCSLSGPGVKFIKANPMVTDMETVNEDNPYRRPNEHRLYYSQTESSALLTTGTLSYGIQAKINYIRVPRVIDITQSGGNGDCELSLEARNELCYMLVAQILEAFNDSRYQTFLNELKQITNS
jgi:hypothetical protein